MGLLKEEGFLDAGFLERRVLSKGVFLKGGGGLKRKRGWGSRGKIKNIRYILP